MATDRTTDSTLVDPALFREVLRHYPTGVVLVTAIGSDGDPVGMLVGTFTSVSLDPPLVAYLPRRDSETFARLRTAASFCVNVMAADQAGLSRRFAGKGAGKFRGVDWHPSPTGAPVLGGTIASIDCTKGSVTPSGDHYVVIGSVTDVRVHRSGSPLVFLRGAFGTVTATG